MKAEKHIGKTARAFIALLAAILAVSCLPFAVAAEVDDVIEGGKAAPQGVATAREQYEFLTGDEYTTVEAANQWLAENYEPPEPEAAAAGKELKR